MVFLFNYRVRKARKYWCRYRYRALKRENNSELLNKLDEIEKTLRALEKQESEITRRRSRLEAMEQIKTGIEEVREEIKNAKKIGILSLISIHQLRSLRKKWCKLRLKILKQEPSDARDKLLDELDAIEDDLQTVEEKRVFSRFDRKRILNSVAASLLEMERKIKGKVMEEKEELEVPKEEERMQEVKEPIGERLESFDRERKFFGRFFGKKEKPIETGETKIGQPTGKMSLEEIKKRVEEIEKEDSL